MTHREGTSREVAALAARVLATGEVTQEEAKRLAGCALKQTAPPRRRAPKRTPRRTPRRDP